MEFSKRKMAPGITAILFVVIIVIALQPPQSPESNSSINEVDFWAYQIQELQEDGSIESLVQSHYDLLVLEPTRTEKGSENFDTSDMISRLHDSPGASLNSKLVIAYIDIGEAEDWRYYWNDSWSAPTEDEKGIPDFLISIDPDDWSGCYPVAYWDDRWKDIIIYNDDSYIQKILDDGFDGIYMDWVEAYDHDPVIDEAYSQGVNPEEEMIEFIDEIRTYCIMQDSDFIVIAQNALGLCDENSEYFELIDGVAQEHVKFRGEADTVWDNPASGDIAVPTSGEEGYSTEWYVEYLDRYIAEGVRVFTVDYALDETNIELAYEFAIEHGYCGFVTQTPLSQLPDTPPPNYP